MELSRQVLFLCTLWYYLDQVHLIPPPTNKGSLPFGSLAATSPLKKKLGCGKSKKNAACTAKLSIVGGKESTSGQWPWMAALFNKSEEDLSYKFVCGSTLISEKWVITAAHCVGKEPNPKTFYVRLGHVKLNDEEKDEGKCKGNYDVDKIVPHPKYSCAPLKNDIALLRLEGKFCIPTILKANIPPICLVSGEQYEPDKYYDGQVAYITGWGAMRDDGYFSPTCIRSGPEYEDDQHHNERVASINGTARWRPEEVYPNILQEACVKVVPQNICAKNYDGKSGYEINDKVICAVEKGKGTCTRDSGGPLMFFNDDTKRFYLGGITSGAPRCADKNYPGVFTKVARFIPFIKNVTEGNF